MSTNMERRRFLAATGAGAARAGHGFASSATAQATKAAPITMVINQSPWFDGFRQLVEQYQKETGNQIQLDVNPYAGALEKIRNSLRSSSRHLRSARDRQQLDGRDVRRRLPDAGARDSIRPSSLTRTSAPTAARSTGTTSSRRSTRKRRQASRRSDQRQRRGAFLSQGPLRSARPEGPADMGRRHGQHDEAERAARRLRLCPSRRPRLGARRFRQLHVQLRRRHLRERERRRLQRRLQQSGRIGARSSSILRSARPAAIPSPGSVSQGHDDPADGHRQGRADGRDRRRLGAARRSEQVGGRRQVRCGAHPARRRRPARSARGSLDRRNRAQRAEASASRRR